jgi:hypothetical protein
VQNALALPVAEFGATDMQHREWQRDRGMGDIVQGSLRLAAHQLLGERPHFGGKYSKRLIEEGMRAVRTAFDPPPPLPKLTKKQLAADKAARMTFDDVQKMKKTGAEEVLSVPAGMTPELALSAVELLGQRIGKRQKLKPLVRKKKWSPLDSRSWRDPKPDNEA